MNDWVLSTMYWRHWRRHVQVGNYRAAAICQAQYVMYLAQELVARRHV